MTWSFSIGRLFGSDIRVHVTFFLLLIWIGYAAYVQAGWPSAVENVLFVLALFACVVAHEFGHALTARRYGIRTPDITLLPIGGMARLERIPEKPAQEILVALAGPAVNVVIWAALVLLLGVDPQVHRLPEFDTSATGLLEQLAMVNLFLAVFNMIPAFPMDGGRVLRAGLCFFTDRVRATRTAASVGQVMALLLGFAGLSSGNPILLLIAFFIFFAGAGESNDVAMRAVARTLLAREAMITHFDSLAPDDTIDAAAAALIRTTQHEFPVLDPQGGMQGFLTRDALFAAMAAGDAGHRPVSDFMSAEIPQCSLASGLETVLDALYKGAPAIAVCDPRGHMIGYINRENIGEILVMRGR